MFKYLQHSLKIVKTPISCENCKQKQKLLPVSGLLQNLQTLHTQQVIIII